MKKTFTIIILLLLFISFTGVLLGVSNIDIENKISNLINKEEDSSKKDYSNLKSQILYQSNKDDETYYRFILFLGGLEEELYNDIKKIEWEIYDLENEELVSKLESVTFYNSFYVTNEDESTYIVYASDYGFDILYSITGYLSKEKEYKVCANVHKEDGVFYKCYRVINT